MESKSAVHIESAGMVTKDFAPPPDGDGASLEMQKHERTGLKTAPDGSTILIPQPSDNPEDPLNWDSFTKHAVLGVVIACSFLPDYGSVTGAVTLHLQAM
jgi:hypothetical protein